MKKVLSFIVVFVLLFVCGCSKTEKMPKGDITPLLTDAYWVGQDDACENKIVFGKDNFFSNSCACGEPIGDADCTEFYSFNNKNKTLDLYDVEQQKFESGKVLFLDESYLVVNLWDDTYVYENQKGHIPTIYDEVKEFVFTDFTKPFLNVLKLKDGILTVTSHDYDGDTPDLFEKWELEITEDVSFRVVSVTDDKGDVKIQRSVLNKEDYEYIGEYYTGGYFEFNEQGQVKSVVFYGELIIQ